MSASEYNIALIEELNKDNAILPNRTVFSIHLDLGEYYELSTGRWRDIYSKYDLNQSSNAFSTVVAYLNQGDYGRAAIEYVGCARRILKAEQAAGTSTQAMQITTRSPLPTGQAKAIADQTAIDLRSESYRKLSTTIGRRGRPHAQQVRMRGRTILASHNGLATLNRTEKIRRWYRSKGTK